MNPWIPWIWGGLFARGHVVNQFFRFCLVGASGVVVNAAAYWLCYNVFGMDYRVSAVFSYVIASINNFIWNKVFTFDDKVSGLWPVLKQYFLFLGICTIGLVITLGVLSALVEWTGMDPFWANLAGVLVATGSNFIGNKLVAFKRR